MKNILRSLLAFVAAIAATFALSYGTDAILVAVGLMTSGVLPSSVATVVLIIAYRTAYNVLGAYTIAKLAPSHPMRHALILGALGAVGGLSTLASHPEYGPAYYAITLAILSLPSAWLGAKLAQRRK